MFVPFSLSNDWWNSILEKPYLIGEGVLKVFIWDIYTLRLFSESKKIIDQNQNFKSPNECTFKLSGKPLKEKMIKVLEKLYNEKVILDHGMKVGTELANVLSGGDTTSDKLLTEDNLYQLELTSFMNLIETDQTKDRIRHTLATGKPLVN